MTRVKETSPGSGEIPEYKSHPSRINISLRKAYDNFRCTLKKKSELVNKLRGNKRDLEVSRDQWKATAKEKETELKKSQADLAQAKKYIEQLESEQKKN